MTITDLRVDWNEAFDNEPRIKVLLAPPKPANSDFIWRCNDRRDIWYAEYGSEARYFHGREDKPDRGYGGSMFNLNMANGSVVTLIGPWASRPAFPNALGFGPCTDASITYDPEVWERGYTFLSGAVRMDEVVDYIEAHPELNAIVVQSGAFYTLRHADGKCVKCHGTGVRDIGNGMLINCSRCREWTAVPVEETTLGEDGLKALEWAKGQTIIDG